MSPRSERAHTCDAVSAVSLAKPASLPKSAEAVSVEGSQSPLQSVKQKEEDPFMCSEQDINKYIDRRIKDFTNIQDAMPQQPLSQAKDTSNLFS